MVYIFRIFLQPLENSSCTYCPEDLGKVAISLRHCFIKGKDDVLSQIDQLKVQVHHP